MIKYFGLHRVNNNRWKHVRMMKYVMDPCEWHSLFAYICDVVHLSYVSLRLFLFEGNHQIVFSKWYNYCYCILIFSKSTGKFAGPLRKLNILLLYLVFKSPDNFRGVFWYVIALHCIRQRILRKFILFDAQKKFNCVIKITFRIV